jgi:hypothetical protein
MHNDDDFFQYFAVDFNEEIMGIHAGDIMAKAVFLNEAVKAIVNLYSAAGKNQGNIYS